MCVNLPDEHADEVNSFEIIKNGGLGSLQGYWQPIAQQTEDINITISYGFERSQTHETSTEMTTSLIYES